MTKPGRRAGLRRFGYHSGMAFGDRTIREPAEYREEFERIRHLEDPLVQHNAAVELLQSAQRDRELTDLPEYDEVIRRIELLERDSGDRLARRDAAAEDET